jgi:hypothetical protein
MVGKRSIGIYSTELSEIILTARLDEIHLVLYDKGHIHNPKHIGDIQNHIIGDILEKKSELVVIKGSPKSCAMFIEGVRPIRFEIVFVGLDIIGYQIGTITSLEDFAADETFDAYHRIFIKSDLDIISRFDSAQLRLCRKIEIHEFFDEEISVCVDDESLIRYFQSIDFYDRSDFKIFFDSTDKLYLLVYIGIQINARALEPYRLSVSGLQ